MSFDPKKYLINLKGKEYLPVAARLVWFRQDHPDWSIITTPVEINLEKQFAIFSASIMNADGKIIATGTKMETVKDFGDYLEKSETGSVGRALAMCGYGTQFAPELSEGARFADSPQGGRFAPRQGVPVSNGNFGNRPAPRPMNGNGNGGNHNDPRPPMPMTAPEDDRSFDAAAMAPPPARERLPDRPTPDAPPAHRLQSDAAAQRAASPMDAASNRVQRVREPEPDYTDPGGADEPDNPDDPFLDDAAPPTPSAPRAAEPANMPPVLLGGDRPNPLAGSPVCSSPGCTMKLTPGQVTLSLQKFGKPLCVIHQKDAAATNASANAL